MIESKRKKNKYRLLRNYFTTINKTFISVKVYYVNDSAYDEQLKFVSETIDYPKVTNTTKIDIMKLV